MMIRTAQDIVEIVRSRGLRVKVDPGPPPMPILVVPYGGPRKEQVVTPALMAALKAWRIDIIELVQRGISERNLR